MTTFLLIRHAHSTANENGVLAGRVDGVELSEIGKKQSADLLVFSIGKVIVCSAQRKEQKRYVTHIGIG